ncbi:ABC transporter permease [Paenibacillus sp. 1P07SE]|uniref:ABC transporter permease n=1 Tax=Paenibacillus sp. 1P07SE TaxID=3132209 RepID=UPI0039A56ABE
MMFIPVIAFFIVAKFAPMFGLVIAFKNYNFMEGILGSPWVGTRHFEMLFSLPQTTRIIKNTFIISVLTVVVAFPFPILLAIMLNEVRRSWFKRGVQTLVYLPHFFSWVIVGGMVVTLFSQQSSWINTLITDWFGSPYPFLYKEGSWLAIFLGSGIWKDSGFACIIYLAAISAIDPTLYEASSMDGAGKWRQIWHVTLPGMAPTIVLILILSLGNVMEVGFDKIYVLQNSVIAISEVISTYIYKAGLLGAQFSAAAAMGLFESLVGFILVLTANQIARKFNRGLW